jgi:K+-transporting ATPase ATPase B chain
MNAVARRAEPLSLFDAGIISRAARDALVKLAPQKLIRNPVIFSTEVVSLLVSVLAIRDLATGQPAGFALAISAWLWLTVLFATFAEAVAEGRGRARAEALRRARTDTTAKLLLRADDRALFKPTPAPDLRVGDYVLVEAGDVVPSDGEVTEGVASVNESAITGESAPVIRESGGDRSAVTGGTTVVSDWLVVRITAASGSTFIDRMIGLVEGAERRKTPNEIALDILLAGMTIIFLFAVVALEGMAAYSGNVLSVATEVALFVCLIPTTIGGLLSAIGIAGMDRLVRFNVMATSGRAVEAAGDVDILLLDKTGTITLGNRMAASFVPVPGVDEAELAEAAALASLGDETPEGRSILAFARDRYAVVVNRPEGATVVAFSANTRLSGLDHSGRSWRKGAVEAVLAAIGVTAPPPAFTAAVERIARSGGTPLAVAADGRLMGAVELKDIVKPGIRARFAELRTMGIRTVMVTGDNRVTAAAIATEAGVDDVIAEATPQDKLSRPMAGWWRCAATAPTTRRRWRRRMWVWRCRPARRRRARLATWSIWTAIRRS